MDRPGFPDGARHVRVALHAADAACHPITPDRLR